MEEAATSDASDLDKLQKVWFKLTPAHIGINLAFDTYSVVIYWNNKDELDAGLEIAIFATISLILGYFVGILNSLAFIGNKDGTKDTTEWEKKAHDSLALYNVASATFEALPQLWISLYTLAVSLAGQDVERGYTYFTAVRSWILISIDLSNFDEVLLSGFHERNITVSRVEKLLLNGCKSMLLLVRMLLIVFMTVRIGWWTALFIGVHFLLVAIVIACRFEKNFFKMLLLAIFFVFSWLSGEDKISYDSMMFWIFSVGHIVGYFVSSATGNDDPFYLLPNFLEIYLSISAFAVGLHLSYVWCRKCCKGPVSPQ